MEAKQIEEEQGEGRKDEGESEIPNECYRMFKRLVAYSEYPLTVLRRR